MDAQPKPNRTEIAAKPDPGIEAAWARLLAGSSDVPEALQLYLPLRAATAAPDGCFVIGRIAQSLDGRIATSTGQSFWISGPDDVLHTHRLRALSDAIVVGAGTIRTDDPLLTTRACTGPSPVRIVLDTERRLGPDRRIFRGGPATIVFVADDRDGPTHLGNAEIVRVPRSASASGLDLASVLSELAMRGLRRIFVEGGGITVSRFLEAGLLDRLHVTVAPLLLGAGIPSFTLTPAPLPQDGLRLAWTPHRLGADMLFDIRLDRARPPSCR